MYADTSRHNRIRYQEDLEDRRNLLDRDLADALEQIRAARHALRLLTDLDGPQPLEIGNSITAAERTLTKARRALSGGNPQPSAASPPIRIQQFYIAALIDQRHIPSATPLADGPTCIACTAAVRTNRSWPCSIALSAPAVIIDAITESAYRRTGA